MFDLEYPDAKTDADMACAEYATSQNGCCMLTFHKRMLRDAGSSYQAGMHWATRPLMHVGVRVCDSKPDQHTVCDSQLFIPDQTTADGESIPKLADQVLLQRTMQQITDCCLGVKFQYIPSCTQALWAAEAVSRSETHGASPSPSFILRTLRNHTAPGQAGTS